MQRLCNEVVADKEHKAQFMFQNFMNEQMQRVKSSPYAGLPGEEAFRKFEEALLNVTSLVTNSTVTRYIAEEAAGTNPFALTLPDLVTDDERLRAIETIQKKLTRGELTFPAPLIERLQKRLCLVTDAFLEMLERLAENREAICGALTGGRLYTSIEDISFSAGDTHNHGRSVTILRTDAGKLVYKPHDMRGDEHIYAIAQRFFPEFAGIPRCIAFGDSFGICEYIEKTRAEGEEGAKSFWYRMGGMAAFMKLLGSTDMHYENVTCSGGKPYILDLETVLSPILKNQDYEMHFPELNTLKGRSPYLSSLLPSSPTGKEYSVLMNTTAEGCAPIVNGKYVSVTEYMESIKDGYKAAYRRAVENRKALADRIREIPDTIPLRILVRSTQSYVDFMKKLYHYSALSSEENREKAEVLLQKILTYRNRPGFDVVVASELRQIKRGDVPYLFTFAGYRTLCSDGEEYPVSLFAKSGKEHALDNLFAMGEKDELFDLKLLERAISQYPVKLANDKKSVRIIPHRTEKPLPREIALEEAGNLLEEAFSLHIPSPDGRLFWGYMNESDSSFRFCDAGFFNGMTGFAAFAAAYLSVADDERRKQMAASIVREAVLELKRLLEYTRFREYAFDYAPNLGECDGTAGMMKGLELLRTYAPQEAFDEFDTYVEELLEKKDYVRYGAPDRFLGMAGLVSVLCRFDRYKGKTGIIRSASDSLLAMKKLVCNGKTLWKTLPNKPHPISGAGHGHAGIAEALFATARVLGEEKYAAAAEEALAFERDVYEKYSEKFGTWADLRSYPPEGYMNGYCSGAPGIGIMLERIKRSGFVNETVEKLAGYARESVDRLPLNGRDHLCCGNSAIVEYYLSIGDPDAAGRVLGAMYDRRKKEGTYRYLSYDYHNGLVPSFFYGISGVGYEMLRYAFPDKIMSVL